jgi:hypothetical protein
MTEHRTFYMDRALLYLFSADIEFEMSFEPLGLVPGGFRLNLLCVENQARVYNVIRERSAGAPGYPTVTGTIVWGQDPVRVSENDVAVADVRATIKTDDGAIIDTTYYGVMPMGQGAFRAIAGGLDAVGTVEKPAEFPLVVAPVYETDSPKYKWLTELQCVGFGRVAQIQGLFRRLSYDVYAMT